MNVCYLLLTAIALLTLSGLPGALLSARSSTGQRVATALMLIGSVLGLVSVAAALCAPQEPSLSLSLAWGFQRSRFTVVIDPLSALFLLPIFIVPALGSIYGLGYWKQSDHPANGQRLGLFYGLLAGAMALVVVSRDGMLFLIAWEVMALAAYFVATAEDDKPEVRRAGWIYLIATHIGTLCLLAMFALWRHATGSFCLAPVFLPEVSSALFVLALIGFGFKAGLMPLHVWLPGAHANAPSHVSAVMSGVMLKMGIYGIVRMTALLPVGASWWGPVLLAIGAFSSVAGIAFAIGQRDLKRILAYSSIENIGIITMGLGLALLGRSLGHPTWVLLGMGGAILHVWNHSLFKSLLFLNAGAVIHVAGTREIDQMGGLAKRVPHVMILFVVGAVAICALPPLNGFVSEWLLYLGLFRTVGFSTETGAPMAALAAVALAMTGALAVACFVKVLGTVFLGVPRRPEVAPAHKPGLAMLVPMLILACGCIGIGLFPLFVTPLLESAVQTWAPSVAPLAIATVLPLKALTTMGVALVGLVAALALGMTLLLRARSLRKGVTWDCGYARPTSRMQYTGSSLGDSIVNLTSFLVWPKNFRSVLLGLFPRSSAFNRLVPDTVLDRLVTPILQAVGRTLPRLRIIQQGNVHLYVLYILIVMIVLLIVGSTGS